MAPRKFEVRLANVSKTRAELTAPGASTPTYIFDLAFITGDYSKNKHSLIMRRGSSTVDNSSEAPDSTISDVIGTGELSYNSISKPIHLGFGNPDVNPNSVVWEALVVSEKWTSNGFVLNIDLGGNLGRQQFSWKRTANVEGKSFVAKNLDWLHLKLVEVETGDMVARFTHHGLWGRKRGEFEIFEGERGKKWEEIVLLSGMAVIEYLRKIGGWSL